MRQKSTGLNRSKPLIIIDLSPATEAAMETAFQAAIRTVLQAPNLLIIITFYPATEPAKWKL
jgi:hypothetical protein